MTDDISALPPAPEAAYTLMCSFCSVMRPAYFGTTAVSDNISRSPFSSTRSICLQQNKLQDHREKKLQLLQLTKHVARVQTKRDGILTHESAIQCSGLQCRTSSSALRLLPLLP